MTIRETVRTAFTRATPENVGVVFTARLALVGIITLIFLITAAIVLLLGPRP